MEKNNNNDELIKQEVNQIKQQVDKIDTKVDKIVDIMSKLLVLEERVSNTQEHVEKHDERISELELELLKTRQDADSNKEKLNIISKLFWGAVVGVSGFIMTKLAPLIFK